MTDKIVTAEEMRHYDSYTINTIGIPSLVLMERAALAVRDEILHARQTFAKVCHTKNSEFFECFLNFFDKKRVL